MYLTTNILELSFKLTERDNQSSTIVLVCLLLCFAFVALGKLNNPDLFRYVTKSFFSLKLQESDFNDESRLKLGTSLLLNLNFIITSTICFFLFFSHDFSTTNAFFYSLIISLYFIIIQQLGFRLTSFLSGEIQIMHYLGSITKQIWHFSGLILLIVALAWSLNTNLNFSFLYLIFFIALYIIRLIKGVFISFKIGFRWYYLIVYLCTLEFLPTYVFYHTIIYGYLNF